MNGGMIKAAGPGAVAAFAALLLSSGSVLAADLGGNCCADLEERVAELEATTARKGNRKVSLTIYGWVNKGIMYWNDGHQSNTYFGVDNTNFATRFGFRGDAKVTPNWKAGFSLLADIITGSNSGPTGVSQLREDATLQVNAVGSTAVPTGGVNAYAEDAAIRFRDANVWVEHDRLGRLTVGHLTNTGPQGIIDLGGTLVASPAAIDLLGGAFIFRRSSDGKFTGATIANNTTNVADFSHRTNSIRWDSATHFGWVLSAAIGEAATEHHDVVNYNPSTATGPTGPYWSAALRYAGEHHGFRVAAAAAYEASDAEERMNSSVAGTSPVFQPSNNTGLSASLLHISTGLFAQGSWIRFERGNQVAVGGGTDDGTLWQIQGGIARNWTGFGNTVFYGEYARGDDLQRTFSSTINSTRDNSGNEYTMWGVGVVQNIDAAAMEIYLAYRMHSLSQDVAGLTQANSIAVLGLNQGPTVGSGAAVDDIHIVFGGMRIAF